MLIYRILERGISEAIYVLECVFMRMSKKPLNLLIEADLVEKARQTGIVISRFLENKLLEHFQFMDAIGYGKGKETSPYADGNNPFIISREPSSMQGKSNNLMLDNQNSSRACGVAWYPCGFGSHRLAFKSQQAHTQKRNRFQQFVQFFCI